MLTLKDICVNFAYKKVLSGISTTFEKGKIYSLLGENGAGKSTLAHVICGDLKPTSGTLYITQTEVCFKSPRDALEHGIACVHQRPLLSQSISIYDNLKIGITQQQYKLLKNSDFIMSLMNIWLPGKKLSTPVKTLSQDEQFFVSLISALLKKPCLLILDEPPSIPLDKLRLLTAQNIIIIMITHNLKEAVEKSDNVILLQNGVIIQESPSADITEEEIKQKLYGFSKKVEIPACIKQEKINESDVTHIFGKTGYIPTDKNFTASDPKLNILQLVTAFHPQGKQSELRKKTSALLQKAEVNIKYHEKADCLSGGMLQRIILQREIEEHPEKLIMFNPTHGLDLQATEKLYNILESLSAQGTEIIFGDAK